MSWDDPDLETNLGEALNRFKWGEVTELCEQTVARIKSESSPIDAEFAKQLLYLLRRKRQFASMVQLAGAMRSTGVATVLVRRQSAPAVSGSGRRSHGAA